MKTQSISPGFSQRVEGAGRQAISFLMQQGIENPQVLSLAAGFVDNATLPVESFQQLRQSFHDESAVLRRGLQYGTTAGSVRLRELCRDHFLALEQSEGRSSLPLDRIVLTTGSQQLLSIICETLFDPGDICLVAAPTYFVFLGTLQGVGARIVSVDTDENGMIPEALEATLERLRRSGDLPRLKLIYLVTYYDNPQGISLSEDRHAPIVELAKKYSERHRIMILEDAAYRELRYDGPVLPSLWGSDPDGDHVLYTQTFSKTFSPGLRVGFGVLPRDFVKPVIDRKANEDFGSSNLCQEFLTQIFERGLYQQHVERLRESYAVKRDAMLSALREEFGTDSPARWVAPHGGLYVWLKLPESVPTGFESPLFRAAVEEQEVMYVPGELFYGHDADHAVNHEMRLSFGVLGPNEIRAGIQRLAAAIKPLL